MNWFKRLFGKDASTSEALGKPSSATSETLSIRGGILTLLPVKPEFAQTEWQKRRRTATGSTIILIDPSDHSEIKEDAEDGQPSEVLSQAVAIDLPEFFTSRLESLGIDEDDEEDEELAIAHQEPDPSNLIRAKKPLKDFCGMKYGKCAYLAEIPCPEPWQVLAYYPFGGWNDVPFDQELTAVFKDWFERFGAVPALISSDIIEFWLDQPVEDPAIAAKLAMEIFILCPDAVDQGTESVEALANSIMGANVWSFWWD